MKDHHHQRRIKLGGRKFKNVYGNRCQILPTAYIFHMNMNFLQGQELVTKIQNLQDNDRRFVKESRISKKLIFRNCLNCRAPLLVHRSSEECKNEPTEEDIKNIEENLRNLEVIKKFGRTEYKENPDKVKDKKEKKNVRMNQRKKILKI